MTELYASPFLGLFLTIGSFVLFSMLGKKIGSPIANPILLSVAFIIFLLDIFDIPLADYNIGGDIITMMLYPVMTVLAYSIYRQKEILKQYFFTIIIGCFVGSVASMVSAVVLCRLFGLDDVLAYTMMPKSVTTPIAIELSKHLGGLPPVTIAAVIITGIMGAMFAPIAIKVFRVTNAIAAGVGIGTASHGVGTSKAIELGEVQGATSGVAMGIAGIITVFLTIVYGF